MPLPRHHNLTDEERKPDSFAQHVLDNAIGGIITLDTAPTTANGLLPEGYFGINSTNLYLTHNSVTYRVALTEV